MRLRRTTVDAAPKSAGATIDLTVSPGLGLFDSTITETTGKRLTRKKRA